VAVGTGLHSGELSLHARYKLRFGYLPERIGRFERKAVTTVTPAHIAVAFCASLEGAKIKEFSPHDQHHTFASQLRSMVGLHTAGQLPGKALRMTAGYPHLIRKSSCVTSYLTSKLSEV